MLEFYQPHAPMMATVFIAGNHRLFAEVCKALERRNKEISQLMHALIDSVGRYGMESLAALG